MHTKLANEVQLKQSTMDAYKKTTNELNNSTLTTHQILPGYEFVVYETGEPMSQKLTIT